MYLRVSQKRLPNYSLKSVLLLKQMATHAGFFVAEYLYDSMITNAYKSRQSTISLAFKINHNFQHFYLFIILFCIVLIILLTLKENCITLECTLTYKKQKNTHPSNRATITSINHSRPHNFNKHTLKIYFQSNVNTHKTNINIITTHYTLYKQWPARTSISYYFKNGCHV